MKKNEDFCIKRNTLIKYTGSQENVVIPDFVTKIGEEAFFKCDSIKSVVVPNSVKKICRGAFAGCSNLSNIELSSSLKKIEKFVFVGCKIHELNHPLIIIKDGFEVKDGLLLSLTNSSMKNIEIPDYIYEIAAWAFAGIDTFESVFIPDTVSEIGDRAFFTCYGLKTLKLDSTFDTEIGECVFESCENLSDVQIIGGKENKYKATFRACNIQNLDFHLNNNYQIKDGFAICDDIIYFCADVHKKEIHIPDGIKKIETLAFCNSKYVETIFIPDSVTEIGSYAFLNCKNLKRIVSKKYSIDGMFVIEDKTKLIGITDASIKSVTIPSFIKSFAEYGIFRANIEELFFEDENNKIEVFEENVEEASETVEKQILDIYKIQNSKKEKIRNIKISSIEAFLETSFKEFEDLKSKAIKVNENSLDVVFRCRSRIISIEISNDFSSNLSFIESELRNFLKIFCDEEKSIEDIESAISKYDIKIADFSFNRESTSVNNINVFDTQIVEIFAKNVENFIEILNEYTKVIFAPCVEAINNPFSYSDIKERISEIVLYEGLRIISSNSFSNCKLLKEISVPYSVEFIGKNAFGDCHSLSKIEIKNSDTVIKNFAFSNCNIKNFKHKNLYIENGLAIDLKNSKLLYNSDFSMTKCIVPDYIKMIGNYAFDDCNL